MRKIDASSTLPGIVAIIISCETCQQHYHVVPTDNEFDIVLDRNVLESCPECDPDNGFSFRKKQGGN